MFYYVSCCLQIENCSLILSADASQGLLVQKKATSIQKYPKRSRTLLRFGIKAWETWRRLIPARRRSVPRWCRIQRRNRWRMEGQPNCNIRFRAACTPLRHVCSALNSHERTWMDMALRRQLGMSLGTSPLCTSALSA